jgi:rubredoxin
MHFPYEGEKKFRCDGCGLVFNKASNDETMKAEFHAMYPEAEEDMEVASVCDTCFEQLPLATEARDKMLARLML